MLRVVPTLPLPAVFLILATAGCSAPGSQTPDAASAAVLASPAHLEAVEEWREGRIGRLQSETGWLSLVGLHWLDPGENRFGTGSDHEVVLPEGTAPELAGSLFLEEKKVLLRVAAGVRITLEGEPVVERELRSDAEGSPDVLRLNDLYFYVIERGERVGIRVKDPNSPVRRDFHGIDYFPVDSSYRMELPLERFDAPRPFGVPDVLGQTQPYIALGTVTFAREGKEWTLTPVVSELEDRNLFIIFGDLTNGKETYGAGRFLYADLREDDVVELDFNRTYNPPCVFTPFATCPLPPRENRLALRIEAGEKNYAGH